jgi:methionyl-tRNA formyltransferase
MKITILCSDSMHPVNAYFEAWMSNKKNDHEISLINSKSQLSYGDILFLISCSEIIFKNQRDFYKKTLIIHASDLPSGKGWSPHIWQIIEGISTLTLTLLEASDSVDSGDIWSKIEVEIPKDALYDEINHMIFEAEINLMNFAIENIYTIKGQKQSTEIESSYYQRRNPEDSRIDPSKSIDNQFDLIRVCDPDRYPAYFELRGKKYKIKLEKIKCQDQ